MSVARSLWKYQTLTSSANAWPPLAGCLLPVTSRANGAHCAAVKDGDHAPTVSRTVLTPVAPRLANARAAEGLPRALLHPKRLHGAREAIWVWLRALRSPTTPSLSAAAFAILTRRARSDSYLYERENNNLAVSDGRPPEKAKNKGAFGISMALWCSGRCNPKTR